MSVRKEIMRALDKKVAAGFGVAFGIVIGLGAVQYLTTRRLIRDDRWVAHTNQVLFKLEVALNEVADAQAATREFVMTDDDGYLYDYRNAVTIMRRKVHRLRELTTDNAEEQRRLSKLAPRIAAMLQEFDKAIGLRQKRQLSGAQELVLIGGGMVDEEQVRAILGQMKEAEFLMLNERIEAAAATNKRAMTSIFIGTMVALLLLAGSAVVVAADLLKRKRMEMELDRERDLMHALMDSVPDVIYFKDRQSRLTRVNMGLARKYGLSDPSEAVGKTVFDFFTREYAEYAFESEQEVMRTGKPLIGVESKQTWPDRPDTWASVTKMAMYDQEGNITGIFGVARDITERKKAEETLRQSQEMFEGLFQSSPDAIVTVGQQGKIMRVNTQVEEMFGYSGEELTGQPVEILIPERFRAAHPAFRREYQAAPQRRPMGKSLNLYGLRKNRTEFPVDIMLSPLKMEEGWLTIAVVRDVTEHKQAEEILQRAKEELEQRVAERTAELAEVNADLERRVAERTIRLEETIRELEAFAYSVAHDLRAPLRHVSGFAQILVDEYASNLGPEARGYLQRVHESAGHMGRLVDDLLSLSRIGRQDLALRPTPLKTLVDSAMADLDSECAKREIEWTIGDLPAVTCDPGLMKQVFVNLLSNAIKYTRLRAPARIEIGTMNAGPETVIFVRDNGAGFDMRYSKKLFGVFQRLHASKDFEGTGVGLAIVHRVLHKHGWRVWAEAELNHGATFFFTVGAPEEAAPETLKAPGREESNASSGN